MKQSNNGNEVYEIDLLRLIKALWAHALIIILTTLIAGAMAFSYARYLIEPKYSSTAMMYVNNSSISIGSSNVSISSGELSAAQSLVETYLVILNSRTTLEEVIEKSGVNYSYEELSRMISSGAVNGTEVFKITVTSTDPAEAKMLANTIADVLPKTISNVVDGSSVRVVDYAVANGHRVSPSYTKYTAIGLAIGFIISAGIVVILELLDDVIHDEEYLMQTYDVPVLAMIPDLENEGKKGYTYYDSKSYYSAYAKSGKGEAKA